MQEKPGNLSRRRMFAGAGTAGALAAIASVLPATREAPVPVTNTPSPPARGGGYALSEHVQQYYKTTRI
ncbi:MAG TPA: formate dehydrogenase [Burkholderiaceae bacterium]